MISWTTLVLICSLCSALCVSLGVGSSWSATLSTLSALESSWFTRTWKPSTKNTVETHESQGKSNTHKWEYNKETKLGELFWLIDCFTVTQKFNDLFKVDTKSNTSINSDSSGNTHTQLIPICQIMSSVLWGWLRHSCQSAPVTTETTTRPFEAGSLSQTSFS